nr:MAG TPA: hypothetical protein [Caudoviricetes sp.]
MFLVCKRTDSSLLRSVRHKPLFSINGIYSIY